MLSSLRHSRLIQGLDSNYVVRLRYTQRCSHYRTQPISVSEAECVSGLMHTATFATRLPNIHTCTSTVNTLDDVTVIKTLLAALCETESQAT